MMTMMMTMILIRLIDSRILKIFFLGELLIYALSVFLIVLISQPADLAAHNLEDPSFLEQSTSSQSSLYFSTQSLRWIQNLSLPQ